MPTADSRSTARGQASVWVAVLALLLGWLVLAWPWLSGRLTIPWDAKAHFLPQLQFLATSFARGDSPFWTPNVFSGHPQIADPQSLIFQPAYVLLAATDPAPTAWIADATLYLMVLLAAASLLLWTRDRGWHLAAGVMTALSFAFGAAMAWRIQHVGQVLSLCYLPIVLVFLDRALTRRSLAYGIASGIAAAFLVLGRDQVALLAVYFLVGYVLCRLLARPEPIAEVRQALPALAGATLAGAAIIAVPILLTLLVADGSNRPAIDLDGAGRGSLHPALFLTALASDVFGASGHGEYWGPPSARWSVPYLYIAQNVGVMYIGALPIVLLILGASSGWLWRRDLRPFTVALVIAVIYALGRYTPGFAPLHAIVPGIDLYRRPADAVFLIGFLASVLSGAMLDRWLATPANAIPRIGIALTAAGIIAAFAAMVTLARAHEMLWDAWPAIARAAGLIALAAALLAYLCVRRPADAIAVALVAALLTADLAVSNGPNGSTGLPPEHYDVLDPATTNDTIALLKEKVRAGASDTRRDRIELVGFDFHWPNASLTHGLENTLGYNPLRLGLYSRATGATDHTGLIEQKEFSPLYPSYASPLADLLGLRYIAASAPVETFDKHLSPGALPLIARTRDGYVYENPHALPRVLFATRAERADFDDIIAIGHWPTSEFAQTVLLADTSDNKPRAPGSARIASYANTHIVLEADSPDGGYVVLNDPFQPWWFATVDGQDAPLLRANVLFRAVAVPPGHHTITMTFDPLRGALRQVMSRP